jgi:hypothetical protein
VGPDAVVVRANQVAFSNFFFEPPPAQLIHKLRDDCGFLFPFEMIEIHDVDAVYGAGVTVDKDQMLARHFLLRYAMRCFAALWLSLL